MTDRVAYMPLDTQADPMPDAAILGAIAVGAAFGCKIHVANLAFSVPPVASPLGGFMINVEGWPAWWKSAAAPPASGRRR